MLENSSQQSEITPTPESLIVDIAVARKALEELWPKIEINPQAARKSFDLDQALSVKEGDNLDSLVESTAPRSRLIQNPTFASLNPTKYKFLSQALAETGINPQRAEDLDANCLDEGERVAHLAIKSSLDLQQRGESGVNHKPFLPEFYAIDVAELKAKSLDEVDGYKKYENRAIIACDLVVLCNNQILEKPKDKEAALRSIMSVSGQEVTISSGIYVIASIAGGKDIAKFSDGEYLKIKLKDFSPEEAETYLNEVGDSCLDIAGGIDYSHPAARRLLSDRPVTISALRLGSSILLKGAEQRKKLTVNISPKLLPRLKDHLIGVPTEAIQSLVHKIQSMS